MIHSHSSKLFCSIGTVITAGRSCDPSIAALCRASIPGCEIHIIKNDQFTIQQLNPHLTHFAAVIVGPGPGSPENPRDIGVIKSLWKLPDGVLPPAFGVCLGLQSLCVEFGARLKRLAVVKHGLISKIHHTGKDLFENAGSIEAVRYHSLHVDVSGCPELEELAWADDGLENGKVLMGVRHTTKPFWAVQYHPESVRTFGGGKQILQNFWSFAMIRNATRNVKPWGSIQSSTFGLPWPQLSIPDAPIPKSPIIIPRNVNTAVVHLSHLSAPEICELLGARDEASPFVVLDSAAKPGRFTVIGSLLSTSPQFIYHCRDTFVTVKTGNNSRKEQLGTNDIWSWMKSFMRQKRGFIGSPDIPFWGGLVGILSYEIGAEKLKVLGQRRWTGRRHPDLNMVFVERSVVVDSTTKNVYVQSLLSNDDKWMSETVASLKEVSPRGATETLPTKLVPRITTPKESLYKSRISLAKEKLFAGESYELCLTAPSHISLPSVQSGSSSSWGLFRDLRRANPAPHSAYLRLHPTTLVSSSPERFLSFSRPSNPVYQLRPIKGTVRKGPGITRAVAEDALIGSPKEVGAYFGMSCDELNAHSFRS
jgi:para-aminobenzoate synthetase